MRDVCLEALAGTLSLEDLDDLWPNEAYSDPFLSVVFGDLEAGVVQTPCYLGISSSRSNSSVGSGLARW